MDDYEANVARQARGPFSKIAERQLIRASAEHWLGRQRWSAETKRKAKSYAWWIGIGFPAALAVYKFIEGVLGKGS